MELGKNKQQQTLGELGKIKIGSFIYEAKKVKRSDGVEDIYYGGQGFADGKRHGHIVVNTTESVTYMRQPGKKKMPGCHDIDDHLPYSDSTDKKKNHTNI